MVADQRGVSDAVDNSRMGVANEGMLITGTIPADVEVLLIGGRSGVGKSTVGWEASRQLQQSGLPHRFIEQN